MRAIDWLRETVAEALSVMFLLRRAVARGGCDPHALRRALEAALVPVQLDDRARALGFRHEDLRRVLLALVATADELTQRPGSLCDYSSPAPPGDVPLLQQKLFKNTTSAGQFFFDELGLLLDGYRPGPCDSAVLEIFAHCLALGFHGRLEQHDVAGHATIRARVLDRLRATLSLPDSLPRTPAVPWPLPRPTSRLLLALAGLSVLFAAAVLLTHCATLSADAAALDRRLGDLTTH